MRLSDGATDKFQPLSPVDPEPNGITRRFAVPDTRLVSGSVEVYLDNELLDLDEYDPDASPAQDEYIDILNGRIEIEPPDTGQQLKVSYHFQWFTDAELQEFLTQAAQLLNFTGVTDTGMATSFRGPILSFAAHYAYLKMAANAAQALQAGAGGFTADTTAEHPNWMNLAKLAWETAQEELKVIAANPATTARPRMAFVNFEMSRYVPRS